MKDELLKPYMYKEVTVVLKNGNKYTGKLVPDVIGGIGNVLIQQRNDNNWQAVLIFKSEIWEINDVSKEHICR